ncbi:ATP-binding protein [Ramlibacter albus]|uniref:ATP-binding protein n=1 Tax=Ramlibacter albus TaxID=2079448 RepID=A0A923M6E3_9BURK|nr:ATP-binding protein [Ramlibacter albus]
MALTLQEAGRLAALVRESLPATLGDEQRDLMEVGLAEALTNIVKHGHGGHEGHDVELSFRHSADAVDVVIIDDGRPIPPHKLQEPPESVFDFDETDVGSLPESGMGLALVRAAFDTLEYRSASGRNVMHLRKVLREKKR